MKYFIGNKVIIKKTNEVARILMCPRQNKGNYRVYTLSKEYDLKESELKKVKNMLITQIIADKVKVMGPKIDGGYNVTFECGEYMQQEISELFKIPQQTEITIIVHSDKGGGK